MSIILLSLHACNLGNQGNNQVLTDSLLADSLKTAEQISKTGLGDDTSLVSVFYQIPSAHQVLAVLSSDSKLFNSSLLLSTDLAKNKIGEKNLAISFGCYTTDVAYCIASNQFQAAVKQYATVRQLADQLGINTAIDENMKKRIEKNLENIDSLQTISTESYFTIVDNLVALDNGKTLTLITVGGYVESLYLLTNANKAFNMNDKHIKQLANLKTVTENIIKCLNYFKTDAQISSMEPMFNELLGIYGQLSPVKTGKLEVTTQKEGIVISGGTEYAFTEKQFNELKTAVNKMRNAIIIEGLK